MNNPGREDRTAALELRPDQVALVGYGSLLSEQKMARVLGRADFPKPHHAELPGWRRLWNGLMPNSKSVSGKTIEGRLTPKNLLFLNLCPTSSSTPANVLVWIIQAADLSIFDEDEQTYERVRIEKDLRGVQIPAGEAYVYTARPEWVLKEPVPAGSAAVLQSYVNEVQSGLESLGSEFQQRFWMTSEAVPQTLILNDLG